MLMYFWSYILWYMKGKKNHMTKVDKMFYIPKKKKKKTQNCKRNIKIISKKRRKINVMENKTNDLNSVYIWSSNNQKTRGTFPTNPRPRKSPILICSLGGKFRSSDARFGFFVSGTRPPPALSSSARWRRMWPPRAWPMANSVPQMAHSWVLGWAGDAERSACRASTAADWARLWLARCPPSAWNDGNCRLQVLHSKTRPPACNTMVIWISQSPSWPSEPLHLLTAIASRRWSVIVKIL